MPWELEHVLPLVFGENRHRESNLRPALVEPHKIKTAEEAKARAKADAQAKKHLGIVKPSTMQSRGFGLSPKAARRAERAAEMAATPLPRSRMLQDNGVGI